MYGQNLVVRSDAAGEPIFTKFCTLVRAPDMFLSFEFQKDRVKSVGAVGVEISLLPLKRHIAYTTACATVQAVIRTNCVSCQRRMSNNLNNERICLKTHMHPCHPCAFLKRKPHCRAERLQH